MNSVNVGFIATSNVRIHEERGEPVLLLHYFNDNWDLWGIKKGSMPPTKLDARPADVFLLELRNLKARKRKIKCQATKKLIMSSLVRQT